MPIPYRHSGTCPTTEQVPTQQQQQQQDDDVLENHHVGSHTSTAHVFFKDLKLSTKDDDTGGWGGWSRRGVEAERLSGLGARGSLK